MQITFTVDQGKLFDALSKMKGDTSGVGGRGRGRVRACVPGHGHGRGLSQQKGNSDE